MKNLILLLSLIIFGKYAYTQNITFVNADNNIPVAEVSIISKTNANLGVISDLNGTASLEIFSLGDTLLAMHIGFGNKSIINNKSNITDTIKLTPKLYLLNEINFEDVKTPLIYNSTLYNKIRRNKIELIKSSNTADLFSKALGINIQESQSGGGSPNLRGMEANRLLIIVDDIPINNAIYRSGHVQSSNRINPFFIDNIRVVTGPASVVYGDGAMGGAIIINTLNNESSKGVSNIIEQKYKSSSLSSSLKYLNTTSFKNLEFITAFAIEANGNLKMGRNRLHGFTNWGNESTITKKNEQLETKYSKYDFIQKLIIQQKANTISLNSQFSTTSDISRFDKLNDIEDGIRKYKNWYYGPQQRLAQSLKINNKNKNLISDNKSLIIAWQNHKESRHKQKYNDSLQSNRYEDVTIMDIILDFKKSIRKADFNYGISLRKQNVNSDANFSPTNNLLKNTTRYPDGGSKVMDAAVYTQFKYKVLKNTTIFFGERYNLNYLTARFNDNSIYNLPYNEITTNNTSLVSSILLQQKLSTKITTNISYYMGYRNPNIDDVGKIFSKNDLSVVVPNENLQPERTNNLEYNLNYNSSIIKFELQLFKTKIKDAIERSNSNLFGQDSIYYDGDLMQVQMNQNIESAEINGLSFGSEISITKKLKFDFKINYIEGITDKGRPLAHIPPINSQINLNYNLKKHFFTLSHIYNGWKKAEDYDDNGVDNLDEATEQGTPAWQIINLAYHNTISSSITFSISAENLFDAHYKTFGSGLSASGRNFIVSLTNRF